jgi:hypothetical protein
MGSGPEAQMNPITDPLLFDLTAAVRKVGQNFGLPEDRIKRGCLSIREQLRTTTDPDYKTVMDTAIRELMRDEP